MFNIAIALDEIEGFGERIAQCIVCDTIFNYYSDAEVLPRHAFCSLECECSGDATAKINEK